MSVDFSLAHAGTLLHIQKRLGLRNHACIRVINVMSVKPQENRQEESYGNGMAITTSLSSRRSS